MACRSLPGAEAAFLRANELKQQGRPDEALTCYRHALDMEPTFASVYNNMANLLKRMEQPRTLEAIASLSTAIALVPDHANAYTNLASIFRTQGRTAESIAFNRAAVGIEPGHATAYVNLGRAHMQASSFSEGRLASHLQGAEGAFRSAIAIQGHSPSASSALGYTLMWAGREAEGRAVLRKAMALGLFPHEGQYPTNNGEVDWALPHLGPWPDPTPLRCLLRILESRASALCAAARQLAALHDASTGRTSDDGPPRGAERPTGAEALSGLARGGAPMFEPESEGLEVPLGGFHGFNLFRHCAEERQRAKAIGPRGAAEGTGAVTVGAGGNVLPTAVGHAAAQPHAVVAAAAPFCEAYDALTAHVPGAPAPAPLDANATEPTIRLSSKRAALLTATYVSAHMVPLLPCYYSLRAAHAAVFTFKISRLARGTSLSPHCGGSNKRWRLHLGLVTDGSARIRVGHETRAWEEGRAFVFDDSFEHEVYWAHHSGRDGPPKAAPDARAAAIDTPVEAREGAGSASGLAATDRLVLLMDVPHPALVAARGLTVCPASDGAVSDEAVSDGAVSDGAAAPVRDRVEAVGSHGAASSGSPVGASLEGADLGARLDAFVHRRRAGGGAGGGGSTHVRR